MGAAPTISEWSTSVLPATARLISEVWLYKLWLMWHYGYCSQRYGCLFDPRASAAKQKCLHFDKMFVSCWPGSCQNRRDGRDTEDIENDPSWLSNRMIWNSVDAGYKLFCNRKSTSASLAYRIFTSYFKPLTCGDRIIPVQHSQYRGCWCPGSLCRQDISTHDIDCVE